MATCELGCLSAAYVHAHDPEHNDRVDRVILYRPYNIPRDQLSTVRTTVPSRRIAGIDFPTMARRLVEKRVHPG